jgi:hypothetical protein
MTDIATGQELLAGLIAYVKRFQSPNSPEQLVAIASSILTFQQKQGITAIAPAQFDDLIQQAVDLFKVEEVETAIVDSTTDALVQNVNQWQKTLENQVIDTLNAYVQQFQSNQFQPNQFQDLPQTILSIVPLVENVHLRKSAAEFLIQRVITRFNMQNAMEQIVSSESIAIAQKYAKSLQFGNLEALLSETILGDSKLLLSQLNQPLENITEDIVNSKLAEILGDNTLQIDIDVDSQQLMVKQVTFKLNVIQSSNTMTKSAEEIATQVDNEVAIFRENRKPDLDFTNLFNG